MTAERPQEELYNKVCMYVLYDVMRMMIIQESDAGILGKKKSECSYQESNLRPSDY